MTFEIVPARIEHMRLAALNLRPMDRAEIEGLGCEPRHLLHRLYRQSPFSRAALINCQIAAVWGITGALLADEGCPWLFTTPIVERQKIEFFRETRRQVEEMLKSRRRLSTYVLASYTQSTRFFTALGFKIGPAVSVGTKGIQYSQMTIERRGLHGS